MPVISQVHKKIRLEQIYRREVKRLFYKMLLDFKITVAGTGLPQGAKQYAPFWRSAIDNHFRRVQKAFAGEVGRSGKGFLFKQDEKPDEEQRKKELLLLALLTWRDQNSTSQADLITETNEKDMTKAISLARQSLIEDGDFTPSNKTLAMAATAILQRRLIARTQAIIMSQTQAAAESTKFTEAEVESGQRPMILGRQGGVTNTVKIWKTVGDKRVRDIHAAANGQRKGLNEPFIVGGQLLQHPGDTALGATARNVINCRCVALYQF